MWSTRFCRNGRWNGTKWRRSRGGLAAASPSGTGGRHPVSSIRNGGLSGGTRGSGPAKSTPRRTPHGHSVIVHRKQHAQKIADRQLANRLKATVEASFDALPIPHLEEGDPCGVYVDGTHLEFVLKQFTIPLAADAPM